MFRVACDIISNTITAMASRRESYLTVTTFGQSQERVIFFFTAFRTKYWLYYPTILILLRAGYRVIAYDVDARMILKGDIPKFLATVQRIREDVRGSVDTLKRQNIQRFYSFGTSFGTVFALRTAIDNSDIQKVVVNLTYGSLADFIWTWRVLGIVKERLMKQNINLQMLEKLMSTISPVSMAPELTDKQILLYASTKDTVIPFVQSSQFRAALKKANVTCMYHESRVFGHFIGCAINNLRGRTYLEFLKQGEESKARKN